MHSLERTFHRCFLPSFNLISKGDNIKSYPSFNSLGKSYLSFNRGEDFLEIKQSETSITVLTKIYPHPISITKTLLIVPTKNERDPPVFMGKLLIKFQNILRNTTQIIIRHRVKILFSIISSPITLKIVKNKRDPPLFTSKQLIKF